MDPFESRLTATAERLGWDEAVVLETLSRRAELTQEPDEVAYQIAEKYELPPNHENEIASLVRPPKVAVNETSFARDDMSDLVFFDDPEPPKPTRIKAAPGLTAPATGVKERSASRSCEGPTLFDFIRSFHEAPDPDELEDLLTALRDTALLAAASHRHGLVLRNLCSDNVFFPTTAEVLWVDPGKAPLPECQSPEQVRGHELNAASDVFALGCMLYECVMGQSVFAQVGGEATLEAVRTDRRRPFDPPITVPKGIERLYRDATAPDAGDRPADAAAFARRLTSLLDADSAGAPIDSGAAPIRDQARRLQAEAEQALADLEGASAEEKKTAWDAFARAQSLRDQADGMERDHIRALERTAADQPGDEALTKTLGRAWMDRHKKLEAEGRDTADLTAKLATLSAPKITRYLLGEGRLTLVTEPNRVRVELFRYVKDHHQVRLDKVEDLGETPLTDVRLPMGSYLCILKHLRCETVYYPVLIQRRTHWHGRGPGEKDPRPIRLPPKGSLRDNELYVPGGWFRCGGAADTNAMPECWTWCSSFIIHRDPVTMREYQAFVDAHPRKLHDLLRPIVSRAPEEPVAGITWVAAARYAKWYAERTGQNWRLPNELEWEKAARGVDGRTYPWGNGIDSALACFGGGATGIPAAADVREFRTDRSPYGVRGMGGNVSDWCRDPWQSRESIACGAAPGVVTDEGPKVVRGGNFLMPAPGLASALRHRFDASVALPTIGFRLARRIKG